MAVSAAIIITVIQEIYKSKETGHSGRIKIKKAIINSNYFIIKKYTVIKRFLQNCHVCRRIKPVHQLSAGLL